MKNWSGSFQLIVYGNEGWSSVYAYVCTHVCVCRYVTNARRACHCFSMWHDVISLKCLK